ncbi:hypothetical protein [Porphyromonas sp. COT-239 OH1446]|uniref:hypothetical protein n=1 Tax=Porphyromonas sp. COT-239 OH1446 TaxID=1515613 RepID=UPI000A8FF317|nr:hypothetical protein [Porphyromonas sp. COT-239 OH1446]
MKYIGICVLLLGALLLIIAGFNPSDDNLLLGSGLALVVLGYLAHIFISKRKA